MESRLAGLEANEEIRELRANYCYHVDDADGEAFASLFAEHAVLDFGDAGVYRGREELRDFVESVGPEHYAFIVHMVHNPVIEVDGNSAAGRWYFEAPATTADGDDVWIQGRSDDEYVRVDEVWRFAAVTARFNYVAGYDEGWGGG